MLKLKLQYLGHLMQTDNSLEKSQMLGKIEGRKKRGCQRMRCLDSITDAMNMNLANLWDMLRDKKAWHAAVHGVTKSWTQLGNWTTTSHCELSQWATLGVHFLFPPSLYANIGALEEEEGSEREQTLPLPPQLESDTWSRLGMVEVRGRKWQGVE